MSTDINALQEAAEEAKREVDSLHTEVKSNPAKLREVEDRLKTVIDLSAIKQLRRKREDLKEDIEIKPLLLRGRDSLPPF